MPGKTKPITGQKLKPENVSFDMTAYVTVDSPPALPLIFLTGWKIDYAPGGHAVPIIKPFPQYEAEPRTWTQWWNNWPPKEDWSRSGISVFYLNNSVKFINDQVGPDGDYFVPDLISRDFKPDGKTYRQLTPDGPLKP